MSATTKFSFDAAAGSPTSANAPSFDVPAPSIETAPADGRPLRILVVEDDADALATTIAAVQALGHWATGVTSAESAMTRYLPGAFDLLLLDVGLPGLSGRDLAESILAIERIPVVFASGNASPTTALPGCAWLRKPFTLDELNDVLSVVPLQPIRDAA